MPGMWLKGVLLSRTHNRSTVSLNILRQSTFGILWHSVAPRADEFTRNIGSRSTVYSPPCPVILKNTGECGLIEGSLRSHARKKALGKAKGVTDVMPSAPSKPTKDVHRPWEPGILICMLEIIYLRTYTLEGRAISHGNMYVFKRESIIKLDGGMCL